MSTQSLLIGLDSVHSLLLELAMRRGSMPFLSSLTASGHTAPIEYEIPMQVAAWTSLNSGLSVADHQFSGFDNLISGSYVTRRGFGPSDGILKYWDHLSTAGKRVLVINNIMGTRPSSKLNGIHLCKFSTHITGAYESLATYPERYRGQLNARFPNDLFHVEDWGSPKYSNPQRLLRSVCSNLERKSQVFSEFLTSENWDDVHIGLDDLHGIGHVLGSVERGTQKSTGYPERNNTDLVLEACSALDRTIGSLVAVAGPYANIQLVALGGISQENTWSHQLDPILRRYEHGPHSGEKTLYDRFGGTWNELPHWSRRLLRATKSHLRDHYLVTKRRSSLAFACPLNEETGAIRVNLKGREPNGRVQPGKEYEDLCQDLAQFLRELRDVESDIPLVDEVIHIPTRLKIDAGLPSSLPDLLVVWTREKSIERIQSARLGQLDRAFRPSRLGDHVIDGLLITCGPAWEKSRAPTRISVLDIAPTILALHGLSAPKGFSGTSILMERRSNVAQDPDNLAGLSKR